MMTCPREQSSLPPWTDMRIGDSGSRVVFIRSQSFQLPYTLPFLGLNTVCLSGETRMPGICQLRDMHNMSSAYL
jgi:hypothetical protein